MLFVALLLLLSRPITAFFINGTNYVTSPFTSYPWSCSSPNQVYSSSSTSINITQSMCSGAYTGGYSGSSVCQSSKNCFVTFQPVSNEPSTYQITLLDSGTSAEIFAIFNSGTWSMKVIYDYGGTIISSSVSNQPPSPTTTAFWMFYFAATQSASFYYGSTPSLLISTSASIPVSGNIYPSIGSQSGSPVPLNNIQFGTFSATSSTTAAPTTTAATAASTTTYTPTTLTSTTTTTAATSTSTPTTTGTTTYTPTTTSYFPTTTTFTSTTTTTTAPVTTSCSDEVVVVVGCGSPSTSSPLAQASSSSCSWYWPDANCYNSPPSQSNIWAGYLLYSTILLLVIYITVITWRFCFSRTHDGFQAIQSGESKGLIDASKL
jgi:hypothetical protein